MEEVRMRGIMSLVVAIALAAPPAVFATQHNTSPALEAAAFRQMASGIPVGSRVRVETTGGRRLTATLMQVTDEAIVVKRESRVPEPALTIGFDELSSLKRHEPRGPGLAKAVGIGLAAGAGAILTLFAIVASVAD
jgi:hypothetical protein